MNAKRKPRCQSLLALANWKTFHLMAHFWLKKVFVILHLELLSSIRGFTVDDLKMVLEWVSAATSWSFLTMNSGKYSNQRLSP